MKKLFIITGPTGVGKTEISIELAKRLNGEIISCDSMQIYKHMNVGSAKIGLDEMQGIKHHLVDIIEPSESFSVADFKTAAENAIDNITRVNKLPFIVGGTGLYINSLICNYDFNEASVDEGYRNYLTNLAEERGKEYVHNLLKDVDFETYNRLYPNDLKRIIRALEVYKLTGKKVSEQSPERIYEIPYKIYYFVLNMDRKILYDRINKRVDLMIEKGLIDEVISLKNMGYTSDIQSMKGIGYKEILYYLDGEIDLNTAVDMIKQGSRNYAKRQLTWFRKDKRTIWVDKEQFDSNEEIINFMIDKKNEIDNL